MWSPETGCPRWCGPPAAGLFQQNQYELEDVKQPVAPSARQPRAHTSARLSLDPLDIHQMSRTIRLMRPSNPAREPTTGGLVASRWTSRAILAGRALSRPSGHADQDFARGYLRLAEPRAQPRRDRLRYPHHRRTTRDLAGDAPYFHQPPRMGTAGPIGHVEE